ncbi:MAG TPA: hemolysin family protein [Candidatus Angelobacter sp.]|jgi:CBS domain containing-hemolysin-like protein|nr:hemolysin family protein [Candidatus Angelobacter sp.]
MNVVTYLVLLLLSALLTLVSYVERLYTESGKFLSREFQENIEAFENRVEPRLNAVSGRAALAIGILVQLITAAIAMILSWLVFTDPNRNWKEVMQIVVVLIVVVITCNRLLPYVMFTRTEGVWLVRFISVLQLLIYLMLPVTLILGFGLSVAALAEPHEPEEPEHPSEAVEALIEAGQEEGILQESDRELIQSVVEFGDKTVREVMTARPEIAAVPADMTVEQFRVMLRERPHTRVPVYVSNIDEIQGMVLSHDVIAIPDDEAKVTMVRKLMRPVLFVPETKKTSELLREMQRENIHLAVVIDEYGAVAGIVTMEDLVEEIVGEIRDEHEDESDVVHEGKDAYIVRGNVDIDRLNDLFDLRVEPHEATTIGGLVSALAGRILQPGEVVEEDGLRFEVLQSTRRRIEKIRVSRSAPGVSAKEKLA